MRAFIFFLICVIANFCSAQTLSNIDFFAEGKKVIITYDLTDCETGEFYDVTLDFVEQSTLKVTLPKTISGDIKKITCGSKRIVWDIGADVSTLSGRFYPELEVKKADKNSVTNIDGNTYKTVQIGTQNSEIEVKKVDKSIVSDIDGNTYKTVQIGTQVWMVENLKTAKYNDGTTIPYITRESTGAWAYYKDDSTFNAKYGKLYNWYAVSKTTNGNKNVCPKGWHVPSNSEWKVLTDYLGGKSIAGGKMKEIGTKNWIYPNADATNTSLFTGLPGGYRYYNRDCQNIGFTGYWWSSTEWDSFNACYLYLKNEDGEARKYFDFKEVGYSVRCLRD